jgi:hypothetical protein
MNCVPYFDVCHDHSFCLVMTHDTEMLYQLTHSSRMKREKEATFHVIDKSNSLVTKEIKRQLHLFNQVWTWAQQEDGWPFVSRLWMGEKSIAESLETKKRKEKKVKMKWLDWGYGWYQKNELKFSLLFPKVLLTTVIILYLKQPTLVQESNDDRAWYFGSEQY